MAQQPSKPNGMPGSRLMLNQSLGRGRILEVCHVLPLRTTTVVQLFCQAGGCANKLGREGSCAAREWMPRCLKDSDR
jgi:hypothetical protein